MSGQPPGSEWTHKLALHAGLGLFVLLVVCFFAPLIGGELHGSGWRLGMLAPGHYFGGATTAHNTLMEVRLPRVLAAGVTGLALGCAGAALQGLLRNPLADSYTVGISSGSALVAVIAIRLGLPPGWFGWGIPTMAILGAFFASWLVWRFGQTSLGMRSATLVLAGITIAMVCSAATLFVQFTADLNEINRMIRWMLGGFDFVPMREVGVSAVGIAIGLVMIIRHSRALNAWSGGHALAGSLGIDTHKMTAGLLMGCALLIGVSIAIAGPIGFVGLLVPHSVRLVLGADHRLVLPLSAVWSAVVLVICDTASRVIFLPAQLPVGVTTALLGGPLFLWLLMKSKRLTAEGSWS